MWDLHVTVKSLNPPALKPILLLTCLLFEIINLLIFKKTAWVQVYVTCSKSSLLDTMVFLYLQCIRNLQSWVDRCVPCSQLNILSDGRANACVHRQDSGSLGYFCPHGLGSPRGRYGCPHTGLASCTCFCNYVNQGNMTEEKNCYCVKSKLNSSNKQ